MAEAAAASPCAYAPGRAARVRIRAQIDGFVEGFRSELLDTRRQLRDVQGALRKDIESLRDRVRFLGIAAVPLLVALVAIILAVVRRIRYRRRFDAAHV